MKVGTKIKVTENLELLYEAGGYGIVSDMLPYAGGKGVITKEEPGTNDVFISVDNSEWSWNINLLEELKEEEVTDRTYLEYALNRLGMTEDELAILWDRDKEAKKIAELVNKVIDCIPTSSCTLFNESACSKCTADMVKNYLKDDIRNKWKPGCIDIYIIAQIIRELSK